MILFLILLVLLLQIYIMQRKAKVSTPVEPEVRNAPAEVISETIKCPACRSTIHGLMFVDGKFFQGVFSCRCAVSWDVLYEEVLRASK